MRRFITIWILPLLVSLLLLPVSAAEAELSEYVEPEAGLEDAVLEEIGPYDGAVEGFGERALGLLKDSLGRLPSLGLREGLRTLGVILAAALFCALLEQGGEGSAMAPLVGGLSIAAACAGPFGSMISLGTETIRDMQHYMSLLLPGISALLAASGGLSATALTGLGILLLDWLLALVSGLLVPLLYLFLLLATAESALGLSQLEKLRDFVKWLLVTAVKGLMWGYSAVLSLTGLVSANLDGQKLRSLRAVIAGMVPVVGNLVSEASGSLLSAAALLKTGAGLYGMLAVFGIFLGPFLRIGLQFLLLKLGAALCGLFGKGSQSGLVDRLSQAMGLVLALTGLACLFSLMILVLCIRTVIP